MNDLQISDGTCSVHVMVDGPGCIVLRDDAEGAREQIVLTYRQAVALAVFIREALPAMNKARGHDGDR